MKITLKQAAILVVGLLLMPIAVLVSGGEWRPVLGLVLFVGGVVTLIYASISICESN